ncbi:WXG100 family type VII secretion target [Mollicutes bacterium LVI A0078]|nr:WXG100 family type VII secretion target [Mollicutes bacterium LVI A0075]WOO91747.1 WXG100 family type VII secretion target [Mollicutes bacterium LVI A0078]
MAISVTPDELRDKADEFRTNMDEQKDIISDSKSLLDELVDDGFEGATSQAFIDKFEELEPDLIAAAELLGEIAEALDQAADNFEELDEEMAGSLNG